MKSKPSQLRRHAARLRDYDYGQTGGYFATICVQDQKCLFGKITDRQMRLNEIGKIALECWNRISQHFFAAELDLCVVMPNHIHGIIVLGIGGAQCPHPPARPQPYRRGEVSSPAPQNQTGSTTAVPLLNRRSKISSPTLGQVIAYFKYQSTKHINQHRDMPGTRIWQRNYYDHVIRDDIDLQRIREYITHNPAQWELDQLYPDNLFN